MERVNSWEVPICNLCGSKKYKIIYKSLTYWEYSGKFRIVRCISCGLIFTSPRPRLLEMEKYYKSKMYFGRDVKKIDSMNDKEGNELSYGPVYNLVFNKKKKGKVLDIGAGTGMLLSKFKDAGWYVDGVELTKSAVSYAKKKYGINLRQGDFLDKKFNNLYDIVILNGSLEHLHKPLETLRKAKSLIRRKGSIVISVPNSDSLGRMIYGRSWFPWQPPRHLYHFSPKTITRMLKKAGFRKIKILHSYDIQNYYILFQSARYAISPKFKKKKSGGLVNPGAPFKSSFSPLMGIGKVLVVIFAYLISKIEPIIRRGEVMIVYAEK